MSSVHDSMRSGPVIDRARARWHEILRGPLGPDSGRLLDDELRRTRLLFGDRPICRVLRPFFLTRSEAARMKLAVEILMRAYRKIYAALQTEPAIRKVLGLSQAEEDILAADQQGIEPDAIARIDGFLIRDGAFKVIEYNAESPGGIAFGDTLVSIFRSLPVYAEFSRDHRLHSFDGLANTLKSLLAAHRTRIGDHGSLHPTIAVVDWPESPTRREFEICADSFTQKGYPSRVVSPNELRFEGGRLRASDFVIDIVYKRVLIKEILDHGGAQHPLVQAVANRAVTCASGFGVHLLYRKELFALFYDARIAPRFDAEERAAIEETVPWSHLLGDFFIERQGRRQHLLDYAKEHQSRLVLKPTAEYGGVGVVLGWTVDAATWGRELDAAASRPSLLQERVELPKEPFPVWHDGKIVFEDYYADINPYIWGGLHSEGFGCRLAAGELLNVTAGGGSAVPVFVLDGA